MFDFVKLSKFVSEPWLRHLKIKYVLQIGDKQATYKEVLYVYMYLYVPRYTPIQNYRSPPQTLVVNLAANLLPPFQIVFPSSIKGQASIINEKRPLLLAFFFQSSID